MPEEVSKMKVADLKRELKLRGLTTTGNKNELQDRLQTALIDGDELLEDAELLTDEEEAKILGAEENELLKSPTTTPTVPLQSKVGDFLGYGASRKIVLKRKNSFCSNTATPAENKTKENMEPSAAKVANRSEHCPITMSAVGAGIDTNALKGDSTAVVGAVKVSNLSLKERLEMRAKKFGLAASSITVNTTMAAKNTANSKPVNDEKQLQMLKRRAERFGCVVSSKMVEIDVKEKLLKRKERFGAVNNCSSSRTTAGSTGVWAEKARQRIERFKAAPPAKSGTF